MNVEYIRTHRTTLLDPAAHKQDKLKRLADTHRQALSECFHAGCRTMTEANSIVTPYDLPYQVKDALKAYVPTITDANNIGSDPPIRFLNRAGRFDRNPDKNHEFAWRVPQPGRGTNFWIPLCINPDDESLWADLVNDRRSSGGLQLLNTGDKWRLHVTLSRMADVRDVRKVRLR